MMTLAVAITTAIAVLSPVSGNVQAAPMRGSCIEIQGTEYLSWDERSWYWTHCIGLPEPAPSSQHLPAAIDHRLYRIKMCESGGNYAAVDPSGTYFGAYQFLPSTFNSVVGKAGYPEYIGVRPDMAPIHVQDAAAQKLYNTSGPGQWPICSLR